MKTLVNIKVYSESEEKSHAHCGHFQSDVVKSGTGILQCAKALKRHFLCHVNFPHEEQSKSYKPKEENGFNGLYFFR